jgi:hypothetical protein
LATIGANCNGNPASCSDPINECCGVATRDDFFKYNFAKPGVRRLICQDRKRFSYIERVSKTDLTIYRDTSKSQLPINRAYYKFACLSSDAFYPTSAMSRIVQPSLMIFAIITPF